MEPARLGAIRRRPAEMLAMRDRPLNVEEFHVRATYDAVTSIGKAVLVTEIAVLGLAGAGYAAGFHVWGR